MRWMPKVRWLESHSRPHTTEEIQNDQVSASRLPTMERECLKTTPPESLSHSLPPRERKAPALDCGCAKASYRSTMAPSHSGVWWAHLGVAVSFLCFSPQPTQNRR